MNESESPTPPAPPAPAKSKRNRKKKPKRPLKVWFPPTALTVTTWITILFILILPMTPIEVWPPDEYLLWPDGVRPVSLLLLTLLFLPLGFFEGWTGASLWRPSKGILLLVILDATFLSGVAELLQWFLVPDDVRDSSILDMIVCVTGSVLGGTVGLTVGPRINRALWGEAASAAPAANNDAAPDA